jgi:hypothetical protein
VKDTRGSGVTLGDVCQALHKEYVFKHDVKRNNTYITDSYAEQAVTDAELASLPVRVQDMVKRIAATHAQSLQQWQGVYYQPQNPPQRLLRFSTLYFSLYPRYFGAYSFA